MSALNSCLQLLSTQFALRRLNSFRTLQLSSLLPRSFCVETTRQTCRTRQPPLRRPPRTHPSTQVRLQCPLSTSAVALESSMPPFMNLLQLALAAKLQLVTAFQLLLRTSMVRILLASCPSRFLKFWPLYRIWVLSYFLRFTHYLMISQSPPFYREE